MRKLKATAAAIAIGMSSLIAIGPALAAPGIVVAQHQQQPDDRKPVDHKTKNQKPGKPQPPKAGPKKQKPQASWHKRGGKMPKAYRGKEVDYRRNHLKQPPRGYHWVRYDDTFVLVAISTGIIASIIAASR